ncbi:hypothetical protein [Streptomyces sp. NRRL WC-3701]|uniref:hypothetical protein n=1 Tax=Streptomyces sp. NRRL WC-3701 TaxID=1519473 RepID=UPI003B63FC55
MQDFGLRVVCTGSVGLRSYVVLLLDHRCAPLARQAPCQDHHYRPHADRPPRLARRPPHRPRRPRSRPLPRRPPPAHKPSSTPASCR